nr:hypothetical protein [Tanacetum cinerariifolium]
MLLEGSELTKEDRESQLYDNFAHFRQHKEESINDYYVRFSKLINDMRNIKITMPKLQLNSKFVNNMLPEWGRFMTAVKLNKRLRESNYDQLFAYLKQHEAHAKEKKMVLERLSQPIAQPTTDPLTLLLNVSNTQHGLPSLSTSNQATVQDGRVVVQNVQGRPNRGQGMNPWGGNAAGYGEAHNRVGNAQENGVALYAEQQLFLAGGPNNAFDDDVDEQAVQDLHSTWTMCSRLKTVMLLTQTTEDTLEIAEITRIKMNAKMTDPECVTHKVKIVPHDYSKENLLATFTPQKQLTPEQIYWSNDLMTLKSEALKEQAKVSRPIKAFT